MLLKKRNTAKKKFKRSKNSNDEKCWHQLNEEFTEAYVKDEINHLEGKLHRLVEAAEHRKLRTTWEIVSEISGKTKNINERKMKKANGERIGSVKELLEEWRDYFSKLFNNNATENQDLTIEPAEHDLDIETVPLLQMRSKTQSAN